MHAHVCDRAVPKVAGRGALAWQGDSKQGACRAARYSAAKPSAMMRHAGGLTPPACRSERRYLRCCMLSTAVSRPRRCFAAAPWLPQNGHNRMRQATCPDAAAPRLPASILTCQLNCSPPKHGFRWTCQKGSRAGACKPQAISACMGRKLQRPPTHKPVSGVYCARSHHLRGSRWGSSRNAAPGWPRLRAPQMTLRCAGHNRTGEPASKPSEQTSKPRRSLLASSIADCSMPSTHEHWPACSPHAGTRSAHAPEAYPRARHATRASLFRHNVDLPHTEPAQREHDDNVPDSET